MKRFGMLLAIATVAGAMYVAAAPGSQQTAGPTANQFAALKKQVASLSKSLKALKKDEARVKSAAGAAAGFIAGCFVKGGVVPVSQFGDATSGTYGFQYTTAPGALPVPRTALDLDASATPQGYLQAVDPSCISSGTAAAHAQMRSSGNHLSVRAERAH